MSSVYLICLGIGAAYGFICWCKQMYYNLSALNDWFAVEVRQVVGFAILNDQFKRGWTPNFEKEFKYIRGEDE